MGKNRDQGLKAYHDEGTRLMKKITENNPEAFERLYNKYGPILEQILAGYHHHPMSSEDFIQEVFTRLWQQRRNFRGESRFLTYLYGIAKHTVNEEIKRSGKMMARCLKEEMCVDRDSHHDLSQPEAEFFLKELTVVFDDARAKLSKRERQVLDISQAGDVPAREASQMMGCSHEAFRSRLRRARKRSQEFLASILRNK